MRNRLTLFLSILLIVVPASSTAARLQVRTAASQGPAVETMPRILDIVARIRRQSDLLAGSVDDTARAVVQARGRIMAAGSPEDKQRALVVLQQMMARTLILGKKSSEETAQLFDQIDAELTMLQREGRGHVEQLQRFKKSIEEEVARQQTLLASVALAAENLNNVLPTERRSQMPGVFNARNAVRQAIIDAYGQQQDHLKDTLDELGTEADSAVAELRGRVQGQAEDARFYANAFEQFANQMSVQVETDRIRDNISRRRGEMDKVEEELSNGKQPVNDLLRVFREFSELQRAVDEDRRRARDERKKQDHQ